MGKKVDLDVMDGRRLRSERSKKAILDASERLMKNGALVPTAQMISDEAKVPIRSFFRHFPDMETLFRAMDEMLSEEYQQLFLEGIPEGTLAERVGYAVELHAKCYEDNKSIFRSTKAQLWRYDVLQDNYARAQSRLRKDLDKRIPELKKLDRDTRDMVDAIASYEMWARLRDHQKRSISKSSAMISSMMLGLLNDKS